MYDFWLKIAFIIQMLVACLVFMAPLRKRKLFITRIAVNAILLILLFYYINNIYETDAFGIPVFLYWGSYLIASIFFVWAGVEGNLAHAVYCTLCAYGVQHVAINMFRILKYGFLCGDVAAVLIYIIVHIIAYFLIAKKLSQNGKYLVNREDLVPMFTIILLVWVFSVVGDSGLSGFEAGRWHLVLYHLIDSLCCLYVLWVQISHKEIRSLQKELDGINHAWSQQIKQYQMTEENIKIINRKSHDLKHQLAALRHITDEKQQEAFFEEIENAIMIYDTSINTGNRALDTVLIEKGMYCKNHGIQWTCMADGTGLNFMKIEDLYAILGNALDNAIAAVLELKDERKRIISVRIIKQESLIMIQIQNYYDKELKFTDGIPETTQKNKNDHGYGMKSIRYMAEKYNGTMTVNAQDSIFTLQILLPMREVTERGNEKK